MNFHDLSETQSKLILERIHHTEKNFSHISEAFSSFARKESRVRDKTDEAAKVFKTISEAERFNKTTEKALENVANGLTFLADHQSLEIQRIEEKVLEDLSQYEFICQNAKEEIKNQIMLRDRELSKRKHMDMAKRAKNENEIILSNMQISKILKEIATIAEQFETQKVGDLKESLKNLVLIEMKYHASCLEVLTMIHEDVSAIDEKEDVEQFKKHLQQSDKPSSGFFLSRIKSQSLGALSSILDKKPVREKPASKRQLQKISKSTMSLNSLDSIDENEIRTESRPQTIQASADSIDTKTSESTDETDSDTDETTTKHEDEQKPSKLPIPIHQVKHFKK